VSEKILSLLKKMDFGKTKIFTELLSVDEFGCNLTADKIKSGETFDVIIHLGLSSKSDKIRFEKYAYNEYKMSQPDNSGRCISNGEIIKNQKERHHTNADLLPLNYEFEGESHVEWSENPGRYICNETYFNTLNAINKNPIYNNIKVIFIHLPPEFILDISKQTEIISRLIKCMTKPYLEVVAGLIFDANNRILSCRRPKEKSWPSWWEFPGGKIEFGETPQIALSRELKEELSLNISPSKIIAEQFFNYYDKYVKLMVLNCGVIEEDRIKLLEHDEMKWLSKEELFDVNWLPADLPIVEKWSIEGFPNPHQY
jgi:8-oxo-dGTP diphosphatase